MDPDRLPPFWDAREVRLAAIEFFIRGDVAYSTGGRAVLQPDRVV